MRESNEYYFQQATEARQMADRAISAEDRAAWLRIAQSWLDLIKEADQESVQK
jgi:hypothetical protein